MGANRKWILTVMTMDSVQRSLLEPGLLRPEEVLAQKPEGPLAIGDTANAGAAVMGVTKREYPGKTVLEIRA